MNRLILAAAALATATPVLAEPTSTQLLVRQHFAADEGGNDAVIFTGGKGITARSAAIHVMIARNQDMANSALVPTVSELLSDDNTVVNATAARIFKQLASEDPRS